MSSEHYSSSSSHHRSDCLRKLLSLAYACQTTCWFLVPFLSPAPLYVKTTHRYQKCFNLEDFISRLQPVDLCVLFDEGSGIDKLAKHLNDVVTSLLDEMASDGDHIMREIASTLLQWRLSLCTKESFTSWENQVSFMVIMTKKAPIYEADELTR